MKIMYIFILTSFSFGLMAFDSDNCNSLYKRNFKKSGDWKTSFISTFGSLTSSSVQAISSWGECSLIGSVTHDQKLFIAKAYKSLQIDLARGNGEFADAFAEISKCNSFGKVVLKRELQKYFREIYEENNEDVEKIHLKILNVMKNDQTISTNCTLDS